METYAVIDTNVLVSALISKNRDTATSQILSHLFDGKIIPVFNDDILKEYNDVLRREKFNFQEEDVKLVLSAIIEFGIFSEGIPAEQVFQDPKDAVFYEVAISKQDSYLVTGNTRHFPKKPLVVTPAEFIEIINRKWLSPQSVRGQKKTTF